MNARRVGLGAFTFIEIGILLAVLIVLNALACNNPIRIDMTADKTFTPSAATHKILGDLDEIINVRAYLSADLPPDYLPIRQEILDQLNDFNEIAKAKNNYFRLTVIEDPDPAKENLEIKGIQPIEFRVQKEGEAQVKRGYMGIYIERVNKSDVIPAVVSTESLEYDLMSAIVRLNKKESGTGKITILQGNGEPSMEEPGGIQAFVKALREKKYTVYPTTLDDKTEIPSTAQTLLVLNSSKLTDFDKYQLDQFLLRGGNLIVMIDRFDLGTDEQGNPDLSADPVAKTFAGADLIEHYGVRAEAKLVGDPSSESAQYRQGMLINQHPYPFWIRVTRNNLSQDNPALSKLEMIDFPWASPLKVIDENLALHPEVKVDILAKSTPAAWALAPDDDAFKGIAPWNYADDTGVRADSIQYPLAVEVSGKFKSFFAGKPSPVGERNVDKERPFIEESEKPGRLIVFGTGKWLTGPEQQGWWAMFQPNQVFMWNLMDYLNLGNDLLDLRSRQVKVRSLAKQWVPENQVKERMITKADENSITLLNIILMPGLLALFAIATFSLKANRKQAYEAKMRADLALDTRLSAAERAEMSLSKADRGGFALPIGSIIGLLVLFAGILGLVMWQLKTEQAKRAEVVKQEEAELFPDFAKNDIEKFEIWEILGKYVFQKSGDQWMVGHVSYTPEKSEEERGAAMPKPEEMALADSNAIKAVLEGIESMQTGVLLTTDDVEAVQMYVGRIGSEYRMFNAKGKNVAQFVVGNSATDFTGTYVQVRPPEQKEGFPVYKVSGYLEPVYKKKTVLDWWDRKLFNMPAESIQQITVTRKGMPKLVIEKADAGWNLTTPEYTGAPLDPTKMSDWVDAIATISVDSWLEQYASFDLQQNPPDWANSDITVSVLPVGATTPIPTLVILTDEKYQQYGGNLSRMGEGIVFHLKDSDLKRLRATAADFGPGDPPAAVDPAAPPPAEATDPAAPPPTGVPE